MKKILMTLAMVFALVSFTMAVLAQNGPTPSSVGIPIGGSPKAIMPETPKELSGTWILSMSDGKYLSTDASQGRLNEKYEMVIGQNWTAQSWQEDTSGSKVTGYYTDDCSVTQLYYRAKRIGKCAVQYTTDYKVIGIYLYLSEDNTYEIRNCSFFYFTDVWGKKSLHGFFKGELMSFDPTTRVWTTDSLLVGDEVSARPVNKR